MGWGAASALASCGHAAPSLLGSNGARAAASPTHRISRDHAIMRPDRLDLALLDAEICDHRVRCALQTPEIGRDRRQWAVLLLCAIRGGEGPVDDDPLPYGNTRDQPLCKETWAVDIRRCSITFHDSLDFARYSASARRRGRAPPYAAWQRILDHVRSQRTDE
jgi:hypothetical protein